MVTLFQYVSTLAGRVLLSAVFLTGGIMNLLHWRQTTDLMAQKGLPLPNLLLIVAVVVTFVLMVALNGFTNLPDPIGVIYLAFACGSVPVLSVLAGLLAKEISEGDPGRLWLAGTLTTIASLVVLPIFLCLLTAVLLSAFGMI